MAGSPPSTDITLPAEPFSKCSQGSAHPHELRVAERSRFMMLPNLPNDARDGESHIRLPRCLGLRAETKRRSEKPWPKSERPNGKSGTKVLRLAKETASRRSPIFAAERPSASSRRSRSSRSSVQKLPDIRRIFLTRRPLPSAPILAITAAHATTKTPNLKPSRQRRLNPTIPPHGGPATSGECSPDPAPGNNLTVVAELPRRSRPCSFTRPLTTSVRCTPVNRHWQAF
jgi:hypothetical protein